MQTADTNAQASALALQALVWTLGEPDRAQRLLDTTGLEPAELRARAGEAAVLAAVLGFLEAHEPDLLACAADLDLRPEALVVARVELDR